MGVWIRTQSREILHFVDNVVYGESDEGNFVGFVPDAKNHNRVICLAVYPTKERCFDVLNAIQDHIQKGNKGVYTMPEGGADG